MDPSLPSASGTYFSVIFFSTAYFIYTCSCDMIYLHREERHSAAYSCKAVGLGLGNSVHGHCCNLIPFVAQTESVLDGGTCEHLSMTLLLALCRPDIISIRTSPTLLTAALLSCPGRLNLIERTYFSDQFASHRFLKQAGCNTFCSHRK